MADKIEGYPEVGTNDRNEVVINLPKDLTGHIVFSITQARNLAECLLRQAAIAQNMRTRGIESINTVAQAKAAVPPVDQSARVLADGSPVTEDHREINPVTGQQKGYVVLTEQERAKGFVRPVRQTYLHKMCGTATTMGLAIAETYARDPSFYSGTFCCACQAHFPLIEFVWDGTQETVGS